MSPALSFAVFDRAFAQPLRYGSHTLKGRRGILFRKESENGFLFSEASPLPGHSTDTFEEALLAARSLSGLSRPELPPSVRFALEGLEAQARPGTQEVRTNALLPFVEKTAGVARAKELARAGYRVCKLKINSESWPVALGLIEEAPGLSFRLDANQSLDPRSFAALVGEVERRNLVSRIEYLEEPFPGVWNDPSAAGAAVALAADESAPNEAASRPLLSSANPPAVFIVKPTVAGGLSSLEGYLALLGAASRKAVVTSTFETEAGRRSLLAFLSRAPHEAAGLSVGHLFARNFLPDRASWKEIPAPGEEELALYRALAWESCG